MEEGKKSKIIVLVVATVIIIVSLVCIFLINNSNLKGSESKDTSKNSTTSNDNSNKKNSHVTENDKTSIEEESDVQETNANQEKEFLYEYVSVDQSALKGYPTILHIYTMDSNTINFKFHTPSNQNDLEGVAKKTGDNTYTYENNDYKFEVIFVDENNEVNITEYNNNEVKFQINLFKNN